MQDGRDRRGPRRSSLGLRLGAEVVADVAVTGASASAAGGASAAALVGALTVVLGGALAREARSRARRSGARSASADLAWDSAGRRRRARSGRVRRITPGRIGEGGRGFSGARAGRRVLFPSLVLRELLEL